MVHQLPCGFDSAADQDEHIGSRAAAGHRVEPDLLELLSPAPDDLLEAFPVPRDLLKLKEPGPEALGPLNSA